jgi:hypothetical protein
METNPQQVLQNYIFYKACCGSVLLADGLVKRQLEFNLEAAIYASSCSAW